MSLQSCQAGSTQGFPISLSQNIFKPWSGVHKNPIKSITIPTDISIKWAPSTTTEIVVVQNTSIFQITVEALTSGLTLQFGAAVYTCSPTLSIVKNQHSKLNTDWGETLSYELLWAFQLINRDLYPSSPNVILLCRPLIITPGQTTPFWNAVNTAVKTNKRQRIDGFDPSSFFSFNRPTPTTPPILLPMVSYSTCLPVKLLNYSLTTSQTGSIVVRSYVCTQPLYITGDDTGTGQCKNLASNYRLAIPNPLGTGLFGYASPNAVFQFQDGLGTDGFPTGQTENLVPLAPQTTQITNSDTVIQIFTYCIPEDFLGKSVAEIAQIQEHTPKPDTSKSYQCFRLDPETDIKNGQIIIDPTTGEPLSDTLATNALNDAGGDPSLLHVEIDNPGIMPGDIQYGVWVFFTIICTIGMVAYMSYIIYNGNLTGIKSVAFDIGIWVALIISLVVGLSYGQKAISPSNTHGMNQS